MQAVNLRMERIERLLSELRYEIERGMMEREIDETLTYRFIVPVSQRIPDGVVMCRFESRPMLRQDVYLFDLEPRLRVIEGGKKST